MVLISLTAASSNLLIIFPHGQVEIECYTERNGFRVELHRDTTPSSLLTESHYEPPTNTLIEVLKNFVNVVFHPYIASAHTTGSYALPLILTQFELKTPITISVNKTKKRYTLSRSSEVRHAFRSHRCLLQQLRHARDIDVLSFFATISFISQEIYSHSSETSSNQAWRRLHKFN